MKRLGLFFTLAGFILGGLHAAELTPGLAYLRPGMKLTPLTSSAVLDLRYVVDDAAAAPLLAAIQPGSTNKHRILLALVSPETSAGLRRQLAALPRCLTIGRTTADFETDIAVSTTAEADRRAVDALQAGTEPEKLLVENTAKTRYDEASLVREHNSAAAPGDDADTPVNPESTTPAPAAGSSGPSPDRPAPAVIDAVLQRAVQIHRGLTVLKKT